MIAHHGLELAAKAEAAKVALKFEAAVAGGIPVIKGLREGAAANRRILFIQALPASLGLALLSLG